MKFLNLTTLLFLLASNCEGRQFGTALGRGLTALPRGGGTHVKPHHGKTLAEFNGGADNEDDDFSIASVLKGRLKASDAVKTLIDKLKSSRRLPYLISFLICCVYSYYFLGNNVQRSCTNSQDGFCVTNMHVKKPREEYAGCPAALKCGIPNSHEWAWNVDVIFTIISLILPFTDYSADNLDLTTKLSAPLLIIFHGFLHKWISGEGCFVPPDENSASVKFYSAFVYALTGVMFFFFSDLPQKRDLIWVLLEVILISYGIVRVSLEKIQEGTSISTLFLTTQLLVSFIGAIHPGKQATKIVGQTFVFPCLVSLLEFLKCNSFAKIGGHVWYDFFLHISIIATLLPPDSNLWNLVTP